MYKIMICGLYDNVKYMSFFSRKEQDANLEFTKACHIAERNANMNNKVDTRIDLVIGPVILKSFTPILKEKQ